MFDPVNREKLVQKLEKHPRPENLNSLKIKICNPEVWSETFQSKIRSKDLKTQKMQGCVYINICADFVSRFSACYMAPGHAEDFQIYSLERP